MNELFNEIVSWIPLVLITILAMSFVYLIWYIIYRDLRDCVFWNTTIANAPVYCHKK